MLLETLLAVTMLLPRIEPALDAARELVAARVRCVLLNDSYHMISIDREKEIVLSEMLQFLAPRENDTADTRRSERVQVLPLFDKRRGNRYE